MIRVQAHFGEWLQGLAGPDGDVALVTLACRARGVSAEWQDAPGFGLVQNVALLDQARAERFLALLGVKAVGRVTLTADLPPGGGAGMSTAALVALARAFGAPEGGIAPACLAIEGASDPLMLPAPDGVLWASRRVMVLADMPPPPKATILGGFWGEMERTDPTDARFPVISDLIEAWAMGPDLQTVARLASASAQRTTDLRGSMGDPTPELAASLGALGWARAHTGPARAVIFPPGAVPVGAAAQMTRTGYEGVFQFDTGVR
ncbi:MAG: propanediol utilization protein [Roseinatronobacter sp.]